MPRQREPFSNRARHLRRLRLGSLVLVTLALLWTGRAHAVTVALLRPENDAPALDEALFRLQGELLALGVSVAIIDGPQRPDGDTAAVRGWLAQAARERGLDAFIAVVGDSEPAAADVWICEPSSPPRLSRVELEPTADDRAATLAIRAIEVLRSNFVALDLARDARPSAKPPAAEPLHEPQVLPREPFAPLGLEAGATALTSFGNVGPALLPLARADWALDRWVSLQATAAGFGTRPRLETRAGHVDVARELGLLGVCLCDPSTRGIHPLFALSAGALRTALDAQADTPNLGHHVERWAVLVDAAVGARLGLARRFYLTIAGHLELAEPYVAIHVLDAVVATTGRPNLLLTLTAGARP